MEQRDNSFVLFKNDKQGNEKRPDMRGNGMVNGQPFEFSAWTKVDKNGNKFLAGSVQLPYQKPQQQATQQRQAPQQQPKQDESEIPW